MKVAALFPGQGSQAVGMGADVADRWTVAASAFEVADRAVGEPLSRLCREGPAEELTLTRNTQPALLATSIACWRALEELGVAVEGVAGHSLGEYSAAVAAGAISLDDAVRTVRERGERMQEAVPVGAGAMAAVLGVGADAVERACAEASEAVSAPVVAANYNAPGQVVIAGAAEAVADAIQRCRAAGARRAVPLPVSAPFHSPLMAPAREGLTPTLERIPVADPSVPLYRNVDAEPVTTARELREGLVRQVDSPVRWEPIVRRMLADGFDTFLEVGPGAVLCGLLRRIDRSAGCLPAGSPEEIEEAASAVAAGGAR